MYNFSLAFVSAYWSTNSTLTNNRMPFAIVQLREQIEELFKSLLVNFMEVKHVFRPIIKLFFLGKAFLEVARERVEDCLDTLSSKAGEYQSCGSERLQESRDRLKEFATEVSQQVWQRSEVLEGQVRERIRRQVADFSLGALGDSTEINELRAEIATLRAEIAELKSQKAMV